MFWGRRPTRFHRQRTVGEHRQCVGGTRTEAHQPPSARSPAHTPQHKKTPKQTLPQWSGTNGGGRHGAGLHGPCRSGGPRAGEQSTCPPGRWRLFPTKNCIKTVRELFPNNIRPPPLPLCPVSDIVPFVGFLPGPWTPVFPLRRGHRVIAVCSAVGPAPVASFACVAGLSTSSAAAAAGAAGVVLRCFRSGARTSVPSPPPFARLQAHTSPQPSCKTEVEGVHTGPPRKQ